MALAGNIVSPESQNPKSVVHVHANDLSCGVTFHIPESSGRQRGEIAQCQDPECSVRSPRLGGEWTGSVQTESQNGMIQE